MRVGHTPLMTRSVSQPQGNATAAPSCWCNASGYTFALTYSLWSACNAVTSDTSKSVQALAFQRGLLMVIIAIHMTVAYLFKPGVRAP